VLLCVCPDVAQVVYEDAYVLVVNKAAHMVVHPSAGHAVRARTLRLHARAPALPLTRFVPRVLLLCGGGAERHAGERGAAPLLAACDARRKRVSPARGALP
jgi:hypothetical protein